MPLKTPWSRLRTRPVEGAINVVVETPRGSRNKYKYDEKLGVFRLNRVLSAGMSFPYDFGYIPRTRAGDGDPLDVLLLMDEPAFPGCLVRARAIGVLRATKDGRDNPRVLAVSIDAKNWSTMRDLADVSKRLLREIEQFFIANLDIEGKHRLLGFRGAREAERLVDRCTLGKQKVPVRDSSRRRNSGDKRRTAADTAVGKRAAKRAPKRAKKPSTKRPPRPRHRAKKPARMRNTRTRGSPGRRRR